MKRILFIALFVFSMLVAPAAQARETLKVGDQGTDVTNLNKQLGKLGYLPANYAKSSSYGQATFHGVVAYQKVRGLTRDGVAGAFTRQALKKSAQYNSRPQPKVKSTASKWIEVSLQQQVMKFVKNGKVVRTIAISSGAPGHATPTGDFAVFRKVIDEYSRTYGGAEMPYSWYFYGGVAGHGSNDPNASGPASHGCLRTPKVFMKEAYSFAAIGTKVYVR